MYNQTTREHGDIRTIYNFKGFLIWFSDVFLPDFALDIATLALKGTLL